jgi:hypothetical protein
MFTAGSKRKRSCIGIASDRNAIALQWRNFVVSFQKLTGWQVIERKFIPAREWRIFDVHID